MVWSRWLKFSLTLMLVLAALSVGVTLSLLSSGQKQNLLVVTSCMLGVAPVILFHIYRKEMLARDKLEKELRETDYQYRRLLEVSTNAIGVCKDGKLVEANEAMLRLVGASRDETLADVPVTHLFQPDQRKNVLERVRRVSSFNEESRWDEEKMLRRDGTAVDVEVTVLPVMRGGDRAVQIVARDISDRKQIEAEIDRARREAEAASHTKSQFLANISHEIRTPVNGVLGMLHLLLTTEITAEQRGYLEMANTSAESLVNLLNDILDISKVEAGKLDLIPVRFSVQECIKLAVSTLSVRLEEKNLEIDTEIGDGVPAALVGDSTRIRQILLNLVGNAIKFTDKGSIAVRVDAEENSDSHLTLHFQVADTGIGIPPGQQRKIFEAFTQADGSLTRRHSGVGLGLAISAHLVSLMNGRIWVESTPGQGSTFHFTAHLARALDRYDAEFATDPELLQLAEAVQPDEPAASPLRILVAEDNKVNQKLATVLLGRLGHATTVVNNGAEAVAEARNSRFDLIFMDIQMPMMDGFEATAAIRASQSIAGSHVPIVALTAHAMKGDEERCRQAGMDDYMSKPMDLAALRARIQQWAPSRRSEKTHAAGAGATG